MVDTTWRGGRLKNALAVTKKTVAPLPLDEPAGIPPIENLTLYAKTASTCSVSPLAKGCAREEGVKRRGSQGTEAL
jgi:hypothetical protein